VSTYEQELAAACHVGSAHATDPGLMAQFCSSALQTLVGAVSPRLVWEGAQGKGLSTRELADLCHTDPTAVADLMWS
jgi:hypothetical protein